MFAVYSSDAQTTDDNMSSFTESSSHYSSYRYSTFPYPVGSADVQVFYIVNQFHVWLSFHTGSLNTSNFFFNINVYFWTPLKSGSRSRSFFMNSGLVTDPPGRIKCGFEFQKVLYVPVIGYVTVVYRSGEAPISRYRYLTNIHQNYFFGHALA
jgi:hypothetical protein